VWNALRMTNGRNGWWCFPRIHVISDCIDCDVVNELRHTFHHDRVVSDFTDISDAVLRFYHLSQWVSRLPFEVHFVLKLFSVNAVIRRRSRAISVCQFSPPVLSEVDKSCRARLSSYDYILTYHQGSHRSAMAAKSLPELVRLCSVSKYK